MEPPDINPPALATLATGGLVSLVVLFRLFEKHIGGKRLLAYEPRRPVPWNYLAPLIVVGPVALHVIGELFLEVPIESAPEAPGAAAAMSAVALVSGPAAAYASNVLTAAALELSRHVHEADRFAWNVCVASAAMLLLIAAVYLVLAKLFDAGPRDLGLPTGWRQVRGDAAIGATAWAAALLPTYGLQWALSILFKSTEAHPLIEQYAVDPSPAMMAAALFSAVIVAPITEESAFRMVFQGWLERLQVRRRTRAAWSIDAVENDLPINLALDDSAAAFGEPGWAPIVTSGVLFGLAHMGQGVAPIPLIVFGFVLGYLYQRTHRLVPCIVCHMLFNAFTLVLVWLSF